jgi:hypothetical protein
MVNREEGFRAAGVFVDFLRWDEQPTQSPKGSEQIVQTRPILS